MRGNDSKVIEDTAKKSTDGQNVWRHKIHPSPYLSHGPTGDRGGTIVLSDQHLEGIQWTLAILV